MVRHAQENNRKTQLRFVFLNFPFVCQTICACLQLNRPRCRNHVPKTIDNNLDRGLLSFRHLKMVRHAQENNRKSQLRFVFLNFPFVYQNISGCLKLNRPRCRNHVPKTIDNDLNRGLLSFRHLKVVRHTEENNRKTQLRFVFLNFPFVCQTICACLKPNRQRCRNHVLKTIDNNLNRGLLSFRPCLHYTGSIIGAPRKPYRIGLLFTFDPAGPAQFL